MEVPRSQAGKDVIAEARNILQLYNNGSAWKPLALHMLNIFIPIMLQKPSAKSKSKDHTRYLIKRLRLWKDGNLQELLAEASEIQKKLVKTKPKKESVIKGFSRLMLLGKVSQALKLIDANSDISGVHELNDEIMQKLHDKHPKPQPPDERVLHDGELPQVQEVVFEEINGSLIQEIAKKMSGSGGPTRVDADVWKHILCSKSFEKEGKALAEEIAVLTRSLCTGTIPSSDIRTLVACRLVPLIKGVDGVRPIGIGEILRRIMGKSVSKILKKDIMNASGTLQTCAGLESGIEGAIHGVSDAFSREENEAVLLVDARNAFNILGREVALNNIGQKCPPLYHYLRNTYREPPKLYLNDGSFILSEEGVTQGDNLAMAMYAIGTRSLIDSLGELNADIVQAWFADDSTCTGKLEDLLRWFRKLKELGPLYGYYPEPSKCKLILKNRELYERALKLFESEGVEISLEGERHLGAVVGSDQFKETYISTKVQKWAKDVEELSIIALEEPQAAFSGYNIGLSQRWTFVQRTVSNISHLFVPLEEAIKEKLIPALCGRSISDLERRIFALPYRYGGMGMQNPVLTADREYHTSREVTSNLANLICSQTNNVSMLDQDAVKEKKQEMKQAKEKIFQEELKSICEQLSEKEKRLVSAAQEKGASSWLSALPIERLGYTLNKRDFRDAICLRYGWPVHDTPSFCACGGKNDLDHVLTCPVGGYTIMRHNALRDTEADLMKEVCRDVKIEPALIPIPNDKQTQDQARCDISAQGVWSPCEKTFFDVRVCHPNAASYMTKSFDALYLEKEKEKKSKYNDRVINIEKASFTPLVFLTTGGQSKECDRLNKRLSELIANKRKEQYCHVVAHVRTRLRFSLLKSTLTALRGYRGKIHSRVAALDNISYNLIPRLSCNEG